MHDPIASAAISVRVAQRASADPLALVESSPLNLMESSSKNLAERWIAFLEMARALRAERLGEGCESPCDGDQLSTSFMLSVVLPELTKEGFAVPRGRRAARGEAR